MNDLIAQLKIVLASTFALYLKAHNFHWNIEGSNFIQYHTFLGTYYADVWGSVDITAEHIRILNSYAPGSFTRFAKLSVITDQLNIPTAQNMIKEIEQDNDKLINELTTCYNLAEKYKQLGLSNYMQDRIDVHAKHGWILKSINK